MLPGEAGQLPSRHDILIDASSAAAGVSLAELWRHRDLLSILAGRDLKVRYRQAVVGIGWAILRPLASVAVFVIGFHWLDREPTTGGVPYAASAMVGLLTWQLFSMSLTELSDSLVRNRHILSKVYFPRVLIPLSALTVSLVDYLVALVPTAALVIWSGVRPGWPIVLLPFWIVAILALSVAVGLLLSALNARYRDIGHAVPFCLQLGFFVSPVVYESSAIVPARFLPIYRLNPLAVFLDGLRWSALGSDAPPWVSVGLAILVLVAAMTISWRVFHWLDSGLADRI